MSEAAYLVHQTAENLGIIPRVFFTDLAWLILTVAINLNIKTSRWAHQLLGLISAYIMVEMFFHGPMEATVAYLLS